MQDFLDIKFGSIYYAIKKSLKKGWVKKIGTEQEKGNPERYVYQILPEGRKRYIKLLKQYFNENFIHFNIDIVLMFYGSLTNGQKEQFIEDRIELVKDKLLSIKDKIKDASTRSSDDSQIYLYTYLESHL